MLYDLFKEKRCFKLICGAGNEDINEVEKLIYLYSLSGANFFDVCAKPEVVMAAKRGLKRAGITKDRYLCVSIGAESDKHFCKAKINRELCAQCSFCTSVCTQSAIELENLEYKIDEKRCIGCSKCIEVCPNNAIELVQKSTDYKEILPPLIKLGLDCIEYHILGDEGDTLYEKWDEINSMFSGPISISINRAKIGDEALISLISKLIKTRKPYSIIIQADGIPMSGGKDSYKSTLQAISTADLFLGANLECYVMCSGGTNSKTAELAKLCGVDIQGVAIGSFARKIVQEYTLCDDFYENKNKLENALSISKALVEKTLSDMK